METRTCKNCSKDFSIEPDDFSFYERIKVPPPTWCPTCRLKRRMFVRNFRTLYKRPSSKSGKNIVSMYHADQPFPVWSTEEWYVDDWDPTDYGRDFDFSRPFFDQYKELDNVLPRFSLLVNNSPDCGYCNLCNRSSKCYFVFGCIENEYCDYGHSIWNCRECVDGLFLFKSEYCYECINVIESNNLLYCQECETCAESMGLFDCRGCVNCIGCVGLRNKSYYIFNQQVTKAEYQQFLKDYPLSDPKNLEYILAEQEKLRLSMPTPHQFGSHNVDATGNYIYNSKNVHSGFNIKSGENSKFGFIIRKMVESYDCNFCLDIENCYESLFSQPNGIRFCHCAIDCSDITYSQFCFNSDHIFGCAGLRKKEYCILNKQYTKEEYEELVPKIMAHMKATGEWGEFFPIANAPYAYNESTVGEYFPLSKSEAVAQGYRWRESFQETRGQENCAVGDIVGSDMYDYAKLKDKIFACTSCARNYRLIEHEVSFYKRFNLPLPTQCFFCRHQARMDTRIPPQLYHRPCMCTQNNHGHTENCPNEFETSYAPERPEIVYCESCYQKEVV